MSQTPVTANMHEGVEEIKHNELKMHMKLSELGEFGFIGRISHGCLNRPSGVIKGMGDDAAVFFLPQGEAAVVTTDLLAEGVHFLRDETTGEDLGYKALVANLSDIAAMGGTPREAFVSIAAPEDLQVEYLEGIYAGMKELGRSLSVNILGGDTSRSQGGLFISLTVVGHAPAAQILYRDGAREGDLIYVSGQLGESRAGLQILMGEDRSMRVRFRGLVSAHLRPRPHLEEGRFLAMCGAATAAMDVSDGVALDLRHMTGPAGLGAELEEGAIPVSDALRDFCTCVGLDPVSFALQGGEDYVLLFALDAKKAKDIEKAFDDRFKRPIYRIGVMTAGGGLLVRGEDGIKRPFPEPGFDHFRRST